MPKLIVISEPDLRRIISNAIEHAFDDVIEAGMGVEVGGVAEPKQTPPPRTPHPPKESVTHDAAVSDGSSLSAEHNGYVIGRADDQYSYADVVDLLVQRNEFSLDDAWETIKDSIVTESPRAKGSVRRSLLNDDRFKKIEGRDGSWFRRVDPNQIEVE